MANENVKKAGKSKTKEEICAEFQSLRNDQRSLVTNLNTLENDLKEHKSVIDTLATVDEGRKCFRLIGGVLCERTVKEVLPQLEENKQRFDKLIEVVNDQLVKKGEEINRYLDEHNDVLVVRQSDKNTVEPETKTEEKGNRNVLVV